MANQNLQNKLMVSNGLPTFSCSIFKCLLISETSPSLEEEENSEKADDFDAVVDFESGLLLRDLKLISEVCKIVTSDASIWSKRILHSTVSSTVICIYR